MTEGVGIVMDGEGWTWGHGWGGWLLMCVVMLLFWGGVVTAMVMAIRYLGTSGRPPAGRPGLPSPRPENTLAERYARGEIDDEEYRRRMALLREHRVVS